MKLSKDQKEQRRVIAQMLCGKGGLNEQCMKNRDALRYYHDFGKLPEREKSVVPVTDRKVEGDLYLLKENARKLVSKLKSKIAKYQQHKQLPEWKANLQKAESDLKFYQSKLDGK